MLLFYERFSSVIICSDDNTVVLCVFRQGEWASVFLKVLLGHRWLISPLIHRLWDLLHKQVLSRICFILVNLLLLFICVCRESLCVLFKCCVFVGNLVESGSCLGFGSSFCWASSLQTLVSSGSGDGLHSLYLWTSLWCPPLLHQISHGLLSQVWVHKHLDMFCFSALCVCKLVFFLQVLCGCSLVWVVQSQQSIKGTPELHSSKTL